MRVALTGARGFTGRFLIKSLAKRGVECVPLSADLTDRDAVEAAVADTAFDRLVHLAGRAFVNAKEWQGFYTVNQLGTFHLLNSVARIRPGVRCVVASTAQVYDPRSEGLIAENAPTCPPNHYAVSKLAMEMGAALWRNKLDIVVARPFNYTGIGQGIEYLVPKIVDHFRRRAETIELGNLFVQRDFGDVRSVAAAYAGLVLSDAPPEVVNICTGNVRSIDDILSILGEISGHQVDVRVNPAFVRANDVAVLGGDATLLRKTLPDWQPRDLADTLAWMYEAPEAA